MKRKINEDSIAPLFFNVIYNHYCNKLNQSTFLETLTLIINYVIRWSITFNLRGITMTDQEKTVEKLRRDDLIRENQERTEATKEETAAIDAFEPWLPIETKMVTGSLICGIIALIILATLIHIFILGVL